MFGCKIWGENQGRVHQDDSVNCPRESAALYFGNKHSAVKVKTSKLTNAYYGKHLERDSSASCQTFIKQTEKVNTYWQLCTQGRSQTPKINGLHKFFFRESLPSRSEGECSWGLKMHHSWHPVHFPLRGGTWQWILGNRDLAGAAHSWENKPDSRECTEPRSTRGCMLAECVRR